MFDHIYIFSINCESRSFPLFLVLSSGFYSIGNNKDKLFSTSVSILRVYEYLTTRSIRKIVIVISITIERSNKPTGFVTIQRILAEENSTVRTLLIKVKLVHYPLQISNSHRFLIFFLFFYFLFH